MNSDDGASAVAILLCFVLVVSALTSRRLPVGATLKMAATWVLIFGAAALLVAWRPGVIDAGRRLLAAADPATGIVTGATLRVPIGSDGHYWVRGTVNGVPVRFLVDSGATTTALSADTVASAKLQTTSPLPMTLQTANGEVMASRVRIDRLMVGPIAQRGLPAVTSDAFGDLDVLGMNFLSGLKRWGVEDGTLILTP